MGADLAVTGGAIGLLQNAELLLGGERPSLRSLGHFRVGWGGRIRYFIGHNQEIILLRP